MKKAPPERIDPQNESGGIVAHHLAKYRLAASLLGSGSVLDVGCGVGYGSVTLAGTDRTIVGVDVADEALAIARARYARDGVSFSKMDGESLLFPDAAFDAVICLEAIEHFHDPERHLREVVRVLKPLGFYLMSTPQPGSGGDPAINPHHHREYQRDDLETLLRGFFRDVRMLGQHRQQSSAHRAAQRADVLGLRKIGMLRPAARAVSRVLGTRATEDAILDDFVIDEDGLNGGSEFVSICREPRA